MKIRRFVPDFLSQTGNTQITLQLRNYPNNLQSSSSWPIYNYISTTKVDTEQSQSNVFKKLLIQVHHKIGNLVDLD